VRRVLLLVTLLTGATLAWLLLRDRPARPDALQLAQHENVLSTFLFGELVRTTAVLDAGTVRGQSQTTEADRREGEHASGVLTRSDGQPAYAWLVGERPSFVLDVLEPLDRELLIDLANGTSGPQSVEVAFNGVTVARQDLPVADTLSSVTASVPAALQRRGRNVVELRFARTEARQLQGEDRPLPLSGVLRHVAFAPPGQTGAAPPPPPARAGIVPDTVDGHPSSVLLLPPATEARGALRLPDAPRVVLRFGLETLNAPLEVSLLLDDGRVPLRTLQPGTPTPSELEFDLSPWAGKPAVLSLWAREAPGGGELAARVSAAQLLVPQDWEIAHAPAALPAAPPPERRPSFLIIVLDAFAQRYAGRVVNGQLVTPALDALAANGLTFADATAPASYTLASVGSLLTGQAPLMHGVLSTVDGEGRVRRLAPDAPLLAAELRARGWHTVAFLTNPNTGARHGFGAGFERYDELWTDEALFRPGRGVSGDTLPARLADFLASTQGQPFLAYVHVFEPHAPYESPSGYAARFVQPYDGPVDGSYEWINAYHAGQVSCDEAGWEHLRQLYASRAAYSDHILGRLLAALVKAGREADTVVVVLGDHGESLGERGLLEHGDAVPPEQLDIPLVLAGMDLGKGRRPGPASVQDIAPTLLRLAGLTPPAAMEGVDLLAGALDPDRPLAANSSVWLPELSWQRGHERLVVDLYTRRMRLYDTQADPGQTHDLSEERPATLALLLRELCADVCAAEAARESRAPDPDGQVLDPAVAAQLAGVGYLKPRTGAPGGGLDQPLSWCSQLRRLLRRL
jgi:arylsulfatase A-like enzyme